MGDINEIIINHQGARSIALQLDSCADAGEKGEVARFHAAGVRYCCRNPLHHGAIVDQADFMIPGRRDNQCFPIVREINGPRIGESLINVVEQDGIDQFIISHPNDAECIGGNPAPLQLRGGDEVSSHAVRREDIVSVW